MIPSTQAQILESSEVRIEWQVVNRFRLFRDPAFFKRHENAWWQYLLYLDGLSLPQEQREKRILAGSVLGSEHVLNDRRIAFSGILRQNFDWRGWAASGTDALCYDSRSRKHSACGGIDTYLNPAGQAIELWLSGTPVTAQCEWRIAGQLVATAACGDRVSGAGVMLPYPGGAEISVNAAGERPIMVTAKARDILIAGLGDSFASGEGNPDRPVAFSEAHRHRNLYPRRIRDDAGGSAQWTDELCHRSLYGQQLRAALQIAVENPKTSITFLDYSCSGAGIDAGILGPQTYVERVSDTLVSAATSARPLSGGSKDSQLYRLLREICLEKPDWSDDNWVCPGNKFRRSLDLVFLSIGGNDIGFSSVVAWAALRDGVSAAIASFFGATVSAEDFRANMKDVLPAAYARLAKAFAAALPLYSETSAGVAPGPLLDSPAMAGDRTFDASRVVLTAYPDLVTDERGALCGAGGSADDPEDAVPANQSLDMFSSWLVTQPTRLKSVRDGVATLFKNMRDLAGDHGWSFADRIYTDRIFEGHGFCARNPQLAGDPAETLMMPCWGKASRETETCQSSWSGKVRDWRPYNPATENFPYALRQRWVRTFNDAYMILNQKVVGGSGKIDEKASAAVFSETTGALHPTAEGHAAMADALLQTVRPIVQSMLGSE